MKKLIITEAQLRQHVQYEKLMRENEDEPDTEKISRLMQSRVLANEELAFMIAPHVNLEAYAMYEWVKAYSSMGTAAKIQTNEHARLKLKTLRTIYLDDEGLTRIPEQIKYLDNVTKLDIRKNKLTELPASIGNLQKLEVLLMHQNKFTVFPEVITTFSHLRHLNISVNKIAQIPDSIGKITTITTFVAQMTKLTELPDSFANNKNIRNLDLSYSPISTEEHKKLKKLYPTAYTSATF